jgi:hypothetical protein
MRARYTRKVEGRKPLFLGGPTRLHDYDYGLAWPLISDF